MSEDLIRREDAIKALRKLGHELVVVDEVCSLGVAVEFIDAVRAITSADRPQGEWITTLSGHWKCSRCNCRAGFWFEEENSCEWDMDMSEWLSDYCPNCGAKMKGADDE